MQVEKEKVGRKVRILEDELEVLAEEKERRVQGFRETSAKLRLDLDKAQRSSTSQEVKDKDF